MVFFSWRKRIPNICLLSRRPPTPHTINFFLYNFNIELTFSIEMHHDLINYYSWVHFRSNGVCTFCLSWPPSPSSHPTSFIYTTFQQNWMNFLWRVKKLKLVSSITNQQFKELSLAYAYFFKEFAENKIDLNSVYWNMWKNCVVLEHNNKVNIVH